ncbi:hypothetical protein ACJX0J_027419, partial [Zea mays]
MDLLWILFKSTHLMLSTIPLKSQIEQKICRCIKLDSKDCPEWILEVLISNHEMDTKKNADGVSIGEIEDIIHNFLIILLEHSMRQKDGWKDVDCGGNNSLCGVTLNGWTILHWRPKDQ